MALKPFKQVIACIQKGNATTESIIEEVGLKGEKGLVAQFKILKEYFDLYPFLQEDGTYALLNEVEYNKRKSEIEKIEDQMKEKEEKRRLLTRLLKGNPQQKFDKFVIRHKSCFDRWIAANTRREKKPDDELIQMKAQKAHLEYKIVEYELKQFQDEIMAALDLDTINELEKEAYNGGINVALEVKLENL